MSFRSEHLLIFYVNLSLVNKWCRGINQLREKTGICIFPRAFPGGYKIVKVLHSLQMSPLFTNQICDSEQYITINTEPHLVQIYMCTLCSCFIHSSGIGIMSVYYNSPMHTFGPHVSFEGGNELQHIWHRHKKLFNNISQLQ